MLREKGEPCPNCSTDTLERVHQHWVCPSCGFLEGCCEGEPLSNGNFERITARQLTPNEKRIANPMRGKTGSNNED